MRFCIVCGMAVDEVRKLFCFPRQRERSNQWQQRMGMMPKGVLQSQIRICDRHFGEDSFIPFSLPLRLKADAMPTIRFGDCSQPSTSSYVHPNCSIHKVIDLSGEMINPTEPVFIHALTTSNQPTSCLYTRSNASTSSFMEDNQSGSGHFSLPVTTIHTIATSNSPTSPLSTRPNASTSSCTEDNQSGSGRFAVPVTTIGLSEQVTSQELATALTEEDMQALPSLNELGNFSRSTTREQSQKKQSGKRRGRALTNLLKGENEVNEIHHLIRHLPATSITFIAGQIRCGKRLSHGRRWTLDEKILALALYKRSPKCYSLLRRMTALPSKDTLTRLLSTIPFEVGINEHVIQHLGSCLKVYEEKDRYCTIAFDEMAIREHIQYSKARDCIEGVEDFGDGRRTNLLARYALVFMAQGVSKPWKQPIAYYFSRFGMSSQQLEDILKTVLNALHRADIPVLATVCDMGTANVKALKNMGSNVLTPFITVDGKEIFTIFDVPHLLKCSRNLFKKHNIVIPAMTLNNSLQTMEARWADLVVALECDKNNPLIFRCLHKIKDYYLAPLRQSAMKVKVAAQIMSKTASLHIFNLVKQGELPSRALATATYIHEVDQMFDSLNGCSRTPPDGKPYRCIVSEDSGHLQFWQECYEKVSNWKYIRKASDLSNPHSWKPPSQHGWMHTLQAFQAIWKFLNARGIKTLKPRALNQDSLENLFGMVRAGCGLNENPTVLQFVSSLKTQIINGLANQSFQGSNCEEDNLNLLSNLRNFIDVAGTKRQSPVAINQLQSDHQYYLRGPDIEAVVDYVTNAACIGSMEILSVAYVSGFILRGVFKQISCNVCEQELCSDSLQPCNQFIAMREYSQKHRKLFYPSEELVVVVGCAITLLEKELPNYHKYIQLQRRCNAIFQKDINFSFLSCDEHRVYLQSTIINSICQIGIPWYCTRYVRNLKAQGLKGEHRRTSKLRHK